MHILLLAFYWPPAGGPGVQRWLKMTKYLVRMGVKVTVYTPRNPDWFAVDESLVPEVPPDVEVLRRKIFEPYRALRRLAGRTPNQGTQAVASGDRPGLLKRLALKARAELFIPDARCGWIAPSTRYLTRWLQAHPVDAVISTGPPHSMHLIARNLHQCLHIPWVADFRDPWLELDYMHHLPFSKRSWKKHALLEKQTVTLPNEVLVVSPQMQRNYQNAYHRPVRVVYNGYDPEDFTGLPPLDYQRPFTITYMGDMNADRAPSALWQAVANLKPRLALTPDNFAIDIYAHPLPIVAQRIAEAGIAPLVHFLPPVPHQQLPAVVTQAALLLLTINQVPNAKGILTGKLFEYLAAQRPILGIGTREGDAAQLLQQTNAGVMFEYNDCEGIERFLRDAWQAYQARQLNVHSSAYQRYSRQAQAQLVKALLDAL